MLNKEILIDEVYLKNPQLFQCLSIANNLLLWITARDSTVEEAAFFEGKKGNIVRNRRLESKEYIEARIESLSRMLLRSTFVLTSELKKENPSRVFLTRKINRTTEESILLAQCFADGIGSVFGIELIDLTNLKEVC